MKRETNEQDAIERVMLGLRETVASDGLEARVLRGAAARVRARQQKRRLGWALTCAGLAGGVAVGVRHEVGMKPGQVVVVHKAQATTLAKRQDMVPSGDAVRLPHEAFLVAKEAEGGFTMRHAAAGRPVPAVAAPVLLEASFPAPPLPLTEQERLLQVIARRGFAQELAAVPVSRLVPEDAAYAAQVAEFERFFYVPPWIEPENDKTAPTTANATQPVNSTGGF